MLKIAISKQKNPHHFIPKMFLFSISYWFFFSLVCECIMEWLRWASSSVLYVKTCCCINVAILKERKKRKKKTNQKKWKRYKEIDDGNESNFHPSLMDWRSFLFHLNYVFSTRGSNVKTIPAGGMFFSPLSFVGSLSPKATVKHPWRWAKWNSKFLRWKWEALPFC